MTSQPRQRATETRQLTRHTWNQPNKKHALPEGKNSDCYTTTKINNKDDDTPGGKGLHLAQHVYTASNTS